MQTRYFAITIGAVFLLVGIAGFLPLFVQPPPVAAPDLGVESGYGYLFGLFPVNALHNLLHLAIGLWGVTAYRGHREAGRFARGLAVAYGALAVMGLIPLLKTLFGLVPLYGHDVWLHALTAAVAAYFGWGIRSSQVVDERTREELKRTA